MSALTLHSIPAQSGHCSSVVFFIHGYGANGADLLSIGWELQASLPNTAFYAPDAPDPCPGAPGGFSWFPIPWLDNSSDSAMRAGLTRSSTQLNQAIQDIVKKEQISFENLFLFGFSQGAMLSLHIGPRASEQLGGIMAFSGDFIEFDDQPHAKYSNPPILLAHGPLDEVVPYSSMREAKTQLTQRGLTQVDTFTMENTGHGISASGLTVARDFLSQNVNKNNDTPSCP